LGGAGEGSKGAEVEVLLVVVEGARDRGHSRTLANLHRALRSPHAVTQRMRPATKHTWLTTQKTTTTTFQKKKN